MFPSLKIRPLGILSASSVNFHGITNSIFFIMILGLDSLLLNHLFFGNTLIRSKDEECTLVFLGVMPRGANVASISVLNLPLFHLLTVDRFQ